MENPEELGIREFARMVGKSDTSVINAIRDGKIPEQLLGWRQRGTKRSRTIRDAVLAQRAWLGETQQGQVRDSKTHGEAMRAHHARRREADGGGAPTPPPAKAKRGRPPKAKPPTLQQLAERDSVQAEQEQAVEEQRNVDPFPHLPTVAQSSREREMYRARREKTAWEEQQGKLVNAEEIRLAMVEMITKAKTTLMGVPSKAKSRIPSLTVADIETLEGLIEAALKEIRYVAPTKSRAAADPVDL